MEFKQYLASRYSESTVRNYLCDIKGYAAFVVDIEEASYHQVMDYIGYLRSRESKRVYAILSAIKSYYHYLIAIGKRNDHPADAIRLRHRRGASIQLQDLFTREELAKLLEKVEYHPHLKHRNKVMMSLLVYQGLSKGEIMRLQVDDIDLASASVYVQGSVRSNARRLKLEANQLYWLVQYLREDRPKLISEATDQLILNKYGKAGIGNEIRNLMRYGRELFCDKHLTAQLIRQSVIHNLLKEGKDLRLVQAFAGHKNPSTTEKYRQTGIEELKSEVLKKHPLGGSLD